MPGGAPIGVCRHPRDATTTTMNAKSMNPMKTASGVSKREKIR